MKLKRLIILPLVVLVFSSINVLPAYAALGDDWDATASGLRESSYSWRSSKISSNGSVLAAVSNNSIFVSTDSGNTWTNKYTQTEKRIFDVELSDDGSTIIAMTRDYISGIGYQSTFFVSKDTGETWSEKNPIGNGFELLDFVLSGDGNKIFTVSNYGRFYHSLDSGDTWSEPTFPTDLTDPLAVEYQRYNIPGQAHDRWKSIDISSDGASLIIAGEGTGVKVSTDLGATWSFVINDRSNWKQVAFANNAATIIAKTDDQGYARGLIKISTDSGQSFSQASCGLTPETQCIRFRFGGPIVWTNFATTADGSKIFAIGNNGGDYWGAKQIYVSTDNGVNWTLSGLAADYQWSHISSDASGNNLMSTSQSGSQINVSNNSGLTWIAKSTGLIPASYYWNDIESSSSGQYIYANRNDNDLFKSSDYGATWSNTNAPGFTAYNNSQIATTPNGATVLAASDMDWYLCNDLEQSEYCTTKLFKSSDYGQNWTTVEIPDIKYFGSISMSDDGQTLVISGILVIEDPYSETYKTYVSRDAGQTWADKVTATEEDISNENVFRKTLISADGQKMVSSTYSKFFYVSADFGDTWVRKSLPGDFDFDSNENTNMAMTSDGSKVYVFMNYGLYVSQDMGTTWSETSIAPQPVDSGYADIKLNRDGSGILLADYNGKVLFSENSGQTWNTIFNNDDDYYLKSITAAQDFSTVALGTESDVYVSHGNSFVPTTTPAANNDSGPATSTPTSIAKPKVEEVKEKIKKIQEEEKEVIKPGTIAAAEPLIMRLIEDLPMILKPQIINIFTDAPVANQILDSNKVLNILKDIVDKIVIDLPSLVRIGGEIQASRLVVVDNTTLQLVTADGGVLSVQANDGENPIPVDQSGKVQMVRSNGVETKGVGLSPNSEFSVYLFSDPTLLGVGKADAQGSFNASFLVDKDFPLGNHTLQINGVLANGKTSSISMPVSVVESVEIASSQAMTKAVAEVKTTNSNFYLIFLLIMLALIGSIIVFKGPRFIYEQFKQKIE